MTATQTSRLEGITTSVAVKPPCRVATASNITLSGLQVVDGVTVAADERVLVKDQSDATDNGIYNASAGTWLRAKDFDGSRDAVGGTLVPIALGATNGNTYWRVVGYGPVEIGTDEIEFESAIIGQASSGSDRNRGIISLLDFIDTDLHDDIFAGTSTVNVASEVQEAIDYLAGLGGGELSVPRGQYTITSTINLKKRVTIRGMGRKASVFRYTGTANAFSSTWAIDSSTVVDIFLCDFGIANTAGTIDLVDTRNTPVVSANTGHGIYEQGGAYVCIHNIWIYGFKFGITYNQTELAEIDLCLIEFQSYCNIWLVNTGGLLGTEDAGYTNRITISRCQLNSGGSYNIVDDGGLAHVYRDNNYNGAGDYHVRAAGVADLAIVAGEWEAAVNGCVLLSSMSAGAVTPAVGVGACGAVVLFNNLFACPAGKPGLNIGACDHVTMVGVAFTSTGNPLIAPVQGMNNVNKLTESGTSYDETGILFDNAGGTTSRIRSETSIVFGQATYDPPSLAAGAIGSPTTVTATGAALGDPIENLSFSLDTQGVEFLARVSAANTVTIIPRNPTAGTIDLASGTLRVQVRRRTY